MAYLSTIRESAVSPIDFFGHKSLDLAWRHLGIKEKQIKNIKPLHRANCTWDGREQNIDDAVDTRPSQLVQRKVRRFRKEDGFFMRNLTLDSEYP